MKNLSIIALIIFSLSVFYSCGVNQNDEQDLNNKEAKKTNVSEDKTNTTAAKSEKKAVASNVVHLSTQEFKNLVFNYDANKNWKYEGSKPCIVDFYADWCRPCKMIAPILDELSKEYEGKLVIYKVNTEKERELASAFGIRSIPSLLFIPLNGKPEMVQGALPKEKFKEVIENVLFKKK